MATTPPTPTWSYGKVVNLTDSGVTDDTEQWSYGKVWSILDYGAAGGTAYERSIAGIMGAFAGGLDRSFTAKRKPLGGLAEPSGAISRAASLSRKIQGEI